MHVLFVTLDVFGGEKKGGGERYATELARAIRARGLTVEIAVVRSIYEFATLDDLDAPARSISLSHFVKMARAADLIHVHQLNTPGFDYAVLFAKVFRKPLVLTDHGGGALTPGRLLGRLRLHLIDAAGFVSAWSRTDIDPSGIVQRNAIILGGGDHLPASQPFEQKYDYGFVGRLLPHKGPHIALAALPENASMILVGQKRDNDYFEELKRLADGKDVTFLPDANDETVASLFKSIRYLVVPSVKNYGGQSYARPELLGLVALEALAAGTPVIGSRVGGLGEVLEASGQIVIEPGDIDAWTKELTNALVSAPPLLDRAHFTWDAVAERTETLYNTLRRNGR